MSAFYSILSGSARPPASVPEAPLNLIRNFRFSIISTCVVGGNRPESNRGQARRLSQLFG
jgi:hypothetical protein